jgi:hypothetical protein
MAVTRAGRRVASVPVPASLYQLFLAANPTPQPDGWAPDDTDAAARGMWSGDAVKFVEWVNTLVAVSPRGSGGLTFRLPDTAELEEDGAHLGHAEPRRPVGAGREMGKRRSGRGRPVVRTPQYRGSAPRRRSRPAPDRRTRCRSSGGHRPVPSAGPDRPPADQPAQPRAQGRPHDSRPVCAGRAAGRTRRPRHRRPARPHPGGPPDRGRGGRDPRSRTRDGAPVPRPGSLGRPGRAGSRHLPDSAAGPLPRAARDAGPRLRRKPKTATPARRLSAPAPPAPRGARRAPRSG